MSKKLIYKGFKGSSHFSTAKEENPYFGNITNIKDVVTYEAETLNGLEREFKKAVDDYLNDCKELQKEPAMIA